MEVQMSGMANNVENNSKTADKETLSYIKT